MNNNGLRLLSFCSQNQLFMSNTVFDLKDIFKGSFKTNIKDIFREILKNLKDILENTVNNKFNKIELL